MKAARMPSSYINRGVTPPLGSQPRRFSAASGGKAYASAMKRFFFVFVAFVSVTFVFVAFVFVAAGAVAQSPARDALLQQADRDLNAGPFSVMHKKLAPSSGDKHDYMSVGPYWWPDPTKPDGLPYIRKDGVINPDRTSAATDNDEFKKLFSAVGTLALAYRETGSEKYAEPATRMNPNLNFGQAVPGRNEGRGTGIIDTAGLVDLARALPWLEKSKAWSDADRAGIKQWFATYLDWLETSKNGKEEREATNNHGTWYDAQVVALALATGQDALAKKTLEAAKQKRVAAEIEPNGSMPRELERTKSFGYSTMNLRAFMELASLGDRAGVDLWNYQTADGRGIRKAVDYLAPYMDPSKQWEHEQIEPMNRTELATLMRSAAIAYKEPRYETLAESAHAATNRMELLWPYTGVK